MQRPVRFAVVETELGDFGLALSQSGLRALVLPGPELRRRLLAACETPEALEDLSALADLAGRLRAYCRGERVLFDDVPLDIGGSPFRQAVWSATRAIPRGQTRTYGEIAARIGKPGAARAVGAAEGANPVAIVVPCHRVVGAGGELRGFGGGLALKARLLALEGAGA